MLRKYRVRVAGLVGVATLLVLGSGAAPAAAQPVTNWTGCYVGAHAGAGWAQGDMTQVGGPTIFAHSRASGLLAGGQLGCDYQFGAWVVGAEGKFSFASINGGVTWLPNTALTLHNTVDQLGTATGRFGYTVDRYLLYINGGFAWTNSSYLLDQVPATANAAGGSSRSGWVLGGGIEYALAPNWSLNLGYSHFDFGNARVDLICNPPSFCGNPTVPTNTTLQMDTVTVGINYRFGGQAH